MDRHLKVVFWNVRGLNNRAKCTAVHSALSTESSCIVCLLETKMSLISSSTIVETLGPQFQDFFFLPADGTRGGILLAWQRDLIALSHPAIGAHHITALVSPIGGGQHWWLTGVYGPREDQAKIEFLSDLPEERATCAGPWLLGGDFNMILLAEDKNSGRLNRRIMHQFRHFTADFELRD